MTENQINKLAKDFADTLLPERKEDDWLYGEYYGDAKQVLSVLANRWLVVEKSKVEAFYHANKQAKESCICKANSCCNQTCRTAYESQAEAAYHAVRLLEILFPETFNQDEI